MQKMECMIVRDLMISYAEELLSENTMQFTKLHLEECPKCKIIYNDLLEELSEQSEREQGTDIKFVRSLKRYRYQLMGAFLGVILTTFLLLGSLCIFIHKEKMRNNTDVYTVQTEEYGEFKDYYGLSELALFPSKDTLGTNGEILSYVYDCSGPKLYQTCQIYLECQYDTNAFEEERLRLQQICNAKTGLSAKTSVDDYEYPAIYAMRNAEQCNEYVLISEEERKVIYIYLQGIIDRRDLHFDEKYLPPDYGQEGIIYEEAENYSIYKE